MAIIDESVRAVLESSALAHLVTLDPDGSPQISIDRVALSFETGTLNERGLVEYLVIHGTARITEGGAPALPQTLAHVYLGADVEFPPPGSPPGYITHISIDRVTGVGPWAR